MIIALGYLANSGKSTVANHLVKEYNFQKISFASTLKQCIKIIYGWNDDHVYGHLKEVVDEFWGVTPREVMQKFGTEACRYVLRDDLWIKSAEKTIMQNQNTNWVFDDCRFLNEAKAIKEWGGLVVRLDRPQAGAVGGVIGHASEVAMKEYKDWDYIINNRGGPMSGLYDKVDMFMRNEGK